ncbi:MAG: exodeoxyribonuclease VII large subunit [Pirellula sp.]|jgi:exodeoxyribonuclease VII large subunit|nr:exodeoxyribonuclease VII large subunit [Pirellula sp.]
MTGFLWSNDEEAFFGDGQKDAPKKGAKKTEPGPGQSLDAPYSVTELNECLKRIIDKTFGTIWIAGEISNLTRSNAGHIYLTLKDAGGQIAGVIWRSTLERIDMDLSEGMAVIVQGRLDVYSPRGNYQIVISRVEEQGLGALQAAFRKLYKKLDSEGLFAAERKKPLPQFPFRIGFVTSPSGAAIQDFIQVLKRRWPVASVLIIPSKVQGEGAAEEIARGIKAAARIRPELDVLVVGRGGGSIEDLWAFNEEIVVRALADCPLPTISAVGHEIDVTLCDLAADMRALTPTEAGEIVAPNRDELIMQLEGVQNRLRNLVAYQWERADRQLASLADRPILVEPERLLERPSQRLDDFFRDMDSAIDQKLEAAKNALMQQAQVLEALSPLAVLARGYSLTVDEQSGKLITSEQDVVPGQTVRTKLSSGEIRSTVLRNDATSP